MAVFTEIENRPKFKFSLLFSYSSQNADNALEKIGFTFVTTIPTCKIIHPIFFWFSNKLLSWLFQWNTVRWCSMNNKKVSTWRMVKQAVELNPVCELGWIMFCKILSKPNHFYALTYPNWLRLQISHFKTSLCLGWWSVQHTDPCLKS